MSVFAPPDPVGDFRRLGEELILSDLMVVEKRMERFEQDILLFTVNWSMKLPDVF